MVTLVYKPRFSDRVDEAHFVREARDDRDEHDQTGGAEQGVLVPVPADNWLGILCGEEVAQFGEARGERLEEFPGMLVVRVQAVVVRPGISSSLAAEERERMLACVYQVSRMS